MKKLILIILVALVLIGIKTNYQTDAVFVEKIKLKLADNQVGISFLNADDINYLLISRNDRHILLALEKISDNLSSLLNKFAIDNLYLLTLKKTNNSNISYKEQILLDENYYFDGIKYQVINNIISIEYEDLNFCIYYDRSKPKNNIYGCNFLYFYSVENVSAIEIDENTEIVFYYYKRPLPTYLLTDIYKKWIDTYVIREDALTIMKIEEGDYQLVVVPDI